MRLDHITGLPKELFIELTERAFQLDGASPERGPGGGSCLFFTRVAMTLMSFRTNCTQNVIADVFGVSQSTVSRIVGKFTPLVAEALVEFEGKLPQDAGTYLLDGTLAPCFDWSDHPELYSGKHMEPGHNIQVVTDLDGEPLYISDPFPGNQHDVRVAREMLGKSSTTKFVADRGYQGLENAETPVKRRPGEDLSEKEKSFNDDLNKIRAPVERAISWLKNWKILATKYRRPVDTFKDTLRAVRRTFFFTR